jgi:hypothetical protein
MSKTPVCPFIKKPCMEHDCMLYTHITMTDPQSGGSRDQWACSLALMPVMVLENARVTRGVQASVDSMRNEVVERQDRFNNMISGASRKPLRDVDSSQQISDAQEKKGR